jgi:hypothetical protein
VFHFHLCGDIGLVGLVGFLGFLGLRRPGEREQRDGALGKQ